MRENIINPTHYNSVLEMTPSKSNASNLTAAEIDAKFDKLVEDPVHPSGLKYALISFCADGTRQRFKNDDGKVALRVRGAFSTVDRARKHVAKLGPELDTYVTELGKWSLIGNIDESIDVKRHLVDLVDAHTKRLEHEKVRFEKRKQHAMKEGIDNVPPELADPCDVIPHPGKTLDTIEEVEEVEGTEDVEGGENAEGATGGISLDDVDAVKVDDLKYVAISYIAPDPEFQSLETPPGVVAIKLRGVYESKDEASKYIESTLTSFDSEHDILVADMYKFLVIPADGDIKDTTYREEYLHDLFEGKAQSQAAASQFVREQDARPELEKLTHPAEIAAAAGPSSAEASDSAGPSGS